jgi:hypothetical protein
MGGVLTQIDVLGGGEVGRDTLAALLNVVAGHFLRQEVEPEMCVYVVYHNGL